MAANYAFAQHRGDCRLHGHDLYIRILILQIFANTSDCAAGTCTSDKNINFIIGIFPDFRAGRCLANRRVNVKLIVQLVIIAQSVSLADPPNHCSRKPEAGAFSPDLQQD